MTKDAVDRTPLPGDMDVEEETRRLQTEVELLRSLTEVTRLVREPDPMTGTLERIGEVAASTLSGCEVGMSLREEPRRMETAASSGARATELDAAQRDTDQGPCLEALVTQQPVRVDVDAMMERWPQFGPTARDMGVLEVLAVPFVVQGRSRGALNVYAFEASALGPGATRLVHVLADQAAVALNNAQLYARASELARNLTLALETRGVIEQAKGVIMMRRRCGDDEAFDALRRVSQRHNLKVRDLARDIVDRLVTAPGEGAALPPEIEELLSGGGDL